MRVALVASSPMLVDLQPFADDLADRHARAERAERILEDDLHLARAAAACSRWLSVCDVAGRRSRCRPSTAIEPQQREAERGLARARFADHAERLALAQRDARRRRPPSRSRRCARSTPRLIGNQTLRSSSRSDLRRRRHRRRPAGPCGSAASRCACRRAAGRSKTSLDRALLDDLALGHHADPVGDLAHDAEVVGDEQQRHAVARLQALAAASGSAPGW